MCSAFARASGRSQGLGGSGAGAVTLVVGLVLLVPVSTSCSVRGRVGGACCFTCLCCWRLRQNQPQPLELRCSCCELSPSCKGAPSFVAGSVWMANVGLVVSGALGMGCAPDKLVVESTMS